MFRYKHDIERIHEKIIQTAGLLHKGVNKHLDNYTNMSEVLIFIVMQSKNYDACRSNLNINSLLYR